MVVVEKHLGDRGKCPSSDWDSLHVNFFHRSLPFHNVSNLRSGNFAKAGIMSTHVAPGRLKDATLPITLKIPRISSLSPAVSEIELIFTIWNPSPINNLHG
jgi:hypothetical protein